MAKKIKKSKQDTETENSSPEGFKITTINSSTRVILANQVTKLYLEGCMIVEVLKSDRELRINQLEISASVVGTPIRVFGFNDGPTHSLEISGVLGTPHISSLKGADEIEEFEEYGVVIRLSKIPQTSALYYLANSEEAIRVKEEPTHPYLQSESIQAAIEKAIKYAKKHAINDILVSGEKKSGKSLLSARLTTRLYKENSSGLTKTFFTNLNLAHSLTGLPEWISTSEVNQLDFVNASNHLVTAQGPGDTRRYLGETSLVNLIDRYKSAIKDLQKFVAGSNTKYFNVVNMHGFTKGYGKFMLASVLDLYDDYVKIEMSCSGSINVSVVKGRKTIKDRICEYQTEGFFTRNSQIARKDLGDLYHQYLLNFNEVVELDLIKVKVEFLTCGDFKSLKRIDNSDHLKLVLTGLIVGIDVYQTTGKKLNGVCLVLGVDTVSKRVILNMPGTGLISSDISYAELIYCNQTQYSINRAFVPVKMEGTELPFNGFKFGGVGAQAVRRKIANLKHK